MASLATATEVGACGPCRSEVPLDNIRPGETLVCLHVCPGWRCSHHQGIGNNLDVPRLRRDGSGCGVPDSGEKEHTGTHQDHSSTTPGMH